MHNAQLPTWIAIGISVGSTSAGQLLLKAGMMQAGVQLAMNQGSARSLARAAASEPRLLVGLLLYALATVAWLFVLGRLPLSAAYPFVGLSFAVVLLLSWLALGEQPDAARLIGTALVITGVGFVARSSAT